MSTVTSLRTPTEADIPEIVRLMSAHSPDPMDEAGVRHAWASPTIDVARDVRLEEGRACVLVDELGTGRVWIGLHGEPSPALLAWAEARGREVGERLFSGSWATNEPLLRALDERGFAPVRHSYRMEIDLAERPPEPVWPEGIEVRTFRPGDERAFYALEQETFEDSWEPVIRPFEEWAHAFLGASSRFAPDLWFLALAGDEPAGFAICYPHPGNPELGRVALLGVRRYWRRRGLGRALLLEAFAAFRKLGLARGSLGVDSESPTGANLLYESAGMRVSARFDIFEKKPA